MSDSLRHHRRQSTRLPFPWDSPGKNTGVGYHFLLQCMKVKSESEVAQSCPTPSDPMDCSLPGSSAHGILQARVLEWGEDLHRRYQVKMKSYWIKVALNPTGVLIRRPCEDTDIHKGEHYMKTETEAGAIYLQVKEHQGLAGNYKKVGGS